MPEFINHYRCPRCSHEWQDQWDAACDDDCPACGCRHIPPFKSEDAPDGDGGREDAVREAVTHMQAMEGMLQSCVDRGVIDREAAKAVIERSKELRGRLD